MLFHDILTQAGKGPSASSAEMALITWDDQATWAQLRVAIEAAKRWIAPWAGRRVGFQFCPSVGGFATLAALDFHACDTCLLDEQLPAAMADEIANQLDLNVLIAGSINSDPTNGTVRVVSTDSRASALRVEIPRVEIPSVTILTSGTEGQPKAARHTWEILARPIRVRNDGTRKNWLLAFRPHLYAGLQVILQCVANGGCLVIPKYRAEVSDVVRMIVDHAVQCVSATPSYWRRLVLFSENAQWQSSAIQQITLGGEIVDQQILNALTARFPTARITHIFATTELGRCFAVTDGKAGFPAEFLDRPTDDGIELRVADNQLWAKSANAMQRYLNRPSEKMLASGSPVTPDLSNDWWCTGDLVEKKGDRVYFLGRGGDTINVGGNKVQPAQVENVIRQVPGVADVQIYGVPSSITGQLVGCRIVCDSDVSQETVRENLAKATSDLASFQRPRVYEFVDQITLTDAGKVTRKRADN